MLLFWLCICGQTGHLPEDSKELDTAAAVPHVTQRGLKTTAKCEDLYVCSLAP